jgi:hypothetical protein
LLTLFNMQDEGVPDAKAWNCKVLKAECQIILA